MAKFLNTKKAVSEIEDLIKDADQKLILISPYLKLSKDFKDLLTYRNSKDKITTVIFGKQELKPDEMKFLESLRFVILKYKDDLHAKCYLNDDSIIITSLNLYSFSMVNNKEMGVLIEKSNPNDTELFEDALKEVGFINDTSESFAYKTQNAPITTVNKPDNKAKHYEKSNNKKSDKPVGYCIRTGVEIPFNIEKPMSYEAFKVWNQYGDPDYPEKFCHFSGESSNGETSVNKPILRKNWKKAKDIFDF